MSQSVVLFANAPAVVESMRNIFRPAWPEPEASIGQHEVFAPIGGKNFWSIQGPALKAYESIQDQIVQSVRERERDLYEGLEESSLPHSIGCFMVGATRKKARPMIVISCSKKPFCKRLKAIIKGTTWWDEFINLHQGFGYFVLLPYPPKRLGSSRDVNASSWAYTSSAVLSLHGSPLWFAGSDWQSKESASSHQAVCGQVLYLDKKPFGMTVAHSSKPVYEDDLEDVQQGGFEAEFDLSDVDESDVPVTNSTEPSSNYPSERLRRLPPRRKAPLELYSQKLKLGPVVYSSNATSSDCLDWALIDLEHLREDRPSLLAETSDELGFCYSEDKSGISVPRPHSVASPTSESVKIFISDGNNSFENGVLSPSKSLVCLPGQREYVTLQYIILKTIVKSGDCGKWAIDKCGNWHGHILAGLPGTSVAYIASAQDIVKDIRVKTKFNEVKLRGRKSEEQKLWEAARKGDLQEVLHLSSLGVSSFTKEGPRQTSALYEAATAGNYRLVELLLDLGAHVNESNGEDETTALWISAANGHANVVALLLKFNADIRQLSKVPQSSLWLTSRETQRTTPLYEAAKRGNESIVRIMLNQATDSKSNKDLLFDALQGAVSSGSNAVIESILKNGPDIHRLGTTAFVKILYWAACNGFEKTVRIMLTYNSTVGPMFDPLSGLETTTNLRSAMHLAVLEENETAISTLFNIINSNLHRCQAREPARESIYTDALRTALMSRGEKRTLCICECIENLKSTQETWRFFLISIKVGSDLAVDRVIQSVHFNVGAMLLSFQHIMDYMTQNQLTKGAVLLRQRFAQLYHKKGLGDRLKTEKSLIQEVKKGDYDMVSMLLHLGYNLNGGDVIQNHVASGNDIPRGTVGDTVASTMFPPSLESKERLASTKRIEDDLQDTKSAIRSRKVANDKPVKGEQILIEMTELFLPLEDTGLSNETPLSLAAGSSHTRMLKLLLDHGADVNQSIKHWGSPLLIAARLGYLDNVKLLVEAGACGLEIPLLGATHNGHTEIVRFLIESGVDVHIRSTSCSNDHYIGIFQSKTHVKDQWTALHIAVDRGHEAILKLLLDAGADPNTETLHGMSALSIAAHTQGYDLAKILLNNGAKPQGVAGTLDIPLHVACEKGDIAMAQLLLDHGAPVDTSGRNHETAVMIAKRRNHLKMIQLLSRYSASKVVSFTPHEK